MRYLLNLKCLVSCKWNSLSVLVQPVDYRSCPIFSSYPSGWNLFWKRNYEDLFKKKKRIQPKNMLIEIKQS